MKFLTFIFSIFFFVTFGQSVDGTYKTVTAGGVANTYTITDATFGGYVTNEKWIVDFGTTTLVNSGSSTINRNSYGAKFIKMPDGTDVAAGVLKGRVALSYNGVYYQVISGATSLSATSPLSYSAGTLSIPAANGTTNGYLSSTDWTTFNGKQSAITFGTGVQSALGNNIGSAGAPVVFNGAGGTPSSLTLTNATGLPLSTGVTGTLALANISPGSSNQILTTVSGVPSWQSSVNLAATTTTVPPITLNSSSSVLNTTFVDGALEYDGSAFYATIGSGAAGARYRLSREKNTGANITVGSTIYFFGSSITAGTGTSTTNNRYANIIGSTLGATINNQAIASSSSPAEVKAMFAIANIQHYPVVLEFGINDMRSSSGGGTGQTSAYLKTSNALRAALANQFSGSQKAANSVTQSGSWSTVSSGTIGERASALSGGLALSSGTVSSTLTWTSPTTTSIVIGTFGTDDVNQPGGVFTVSIDGSVVTTYDNRGRTNGGTDGTGYQNNITQDAIIITGLSSTTHTVVVTVTSLSTSGKVFIDYFSTLASPQSCLPVLVMGVPKMDATGYATGAAGANDQVMNQCDIYLRNVTLEFTGYPVYFVNTNKNFNAATDLYTDHIHRNDVGNSRIAVNMMEAITQIPSQALATFNVGNTNNGYVAQISSGSLALSANYNPISTSINDAAKAVSQINLSTASGDGHIDFFSSNTNNVAPTNTLTLDNLGVLNYKDPGGGQVGYVYEGTNSLQISVNRNPSTGTFFNTSKSAAGININGSSGGSLLIFQTANANNTTQTTKMTLDGNGKLRVGDATLPTEVLDVTGNLLLNTAGNKIKITTGSNASAGTGTFSGGTATISTTAVTASSLIFIQHTSCSSCGVPYISTKTAGTSFVVTSNNASDASTFNWWIIN